MCGITGIINLTNDLVCEKNEILNFNKSLIHRGPDDNGIYINSNKKISLGHCRLNIIDLTQNGKQPMSYLNDRYWITFNGEIFNFLELKKELKFFGYKFYNNTDTEVILASYDKWGENCFNKFNGMWAIGIWDNKEKKFCLSRDRFGEKPLYYRVKNNRLSFASELKSFKYLNDFDLSELDYKILDNFQNLENNFTNFIKTANTLEPGSNLIVKNNKIFLNKWWSIHDHITKKDNSYEERLEEFKDLFIDSCKIRLRTDRKLATSLSGGVDSTTILATIKNFYNDDFEIPSYSVLFKNTIYDESKYIEEIEKFHQNKINKIDFSKIQLSPEELIKIIYSNENLDEPHIGPWLIYKEMKSHNNVVSIDGHGSDEMLGGYYDHFQFAINDQVNLQNKIKLKNLQKEIFLNDEKSNEKKLNNEINFKKNLKYYLKKIIPFHFRKKFHKKTPLDNISFKEKSFNTHLNKKLFHDFHSFSLPKILNNYDKLSMAHGIEVRSPFLDWRLVKFCFSLSSEDKISTHNNKVILRDYMKKITPKNIYSRKSKIGFVTPPNFFREKNLESFINDTVNEKDFLSNNFFDGRLIKNQFLRITNLSNYNPSKWSDVPFWKYIQTYILYKSFESND